MGTQRYITILEWQLRLGLKGNELIALALIWGFCQSGQKYTGSASYLSMWLGCTKRGAFNILSNLVDKGFLLKEDRVENGVKFCSYMVDVEYCKNFIGDEKSSSGGDEKSSHNNIDIINIDNTLSKGAGRFQKPSIEEIRDYCIQRQNNVDAEAFFNFYKSNGWKVGKNTMKDWKAAVRTWENRQRQESPRRSGGGQQKRDKFSEMMETGMRMFGAEKEVCDEQ